MNEYPDQNRNEKMKSKCYNDKCMSHDKNDNCTDYRGPNETTGGICFNWMSEKRKHVNKNIDDLKTHNMPVSVHFDPSPTRGHTLKFVDVVSKQDLKDLAIRDVKECKRHFEFDDESTQDSRRDIRIIENIRCGSVRDGKARRCPGCRRLMRFCKVKESDV